MDKEQLFYIGTRSQETGNWTFWKYGVIYIKTSRYKLKSLHHIEGQRKVYHMGYDEEKVGLDIATEHAIAIDQGKTIKVNLGEW